MPHLTAFELADSAAYPGVPHRFWVSVPPSHDEAEPARLVVFLDGEGFLDPDEGIRADLVLDELPAATVGVFVEAGVQPGKSARPRQRNVEYDAADDRYAGFLLEEVLPCVTARWQVTDDPARRVLCGFSSGGNAAFTAAWHRPDAFGGVVSASGSFAQMPGGNPYPALIASAPPKPLRVWLQVGRHDLGWDEPDEESWVVHNRRVATALQEASYDVRLEVVDGGHDPADLARALPEALTWVLG